MSLQADPNADVRGRMINAGIMIIDRQGRDNVSLLFPIFENYLNKKVITFLPNLNPLLLYIFCWFPACIIKCWSKLFFLFMSFCRTCSILVHNFSLCVGIRWRKIWSGSWRCSYFYRSLSKTFGKGVDFTASFFLIIRRTSHRPRLVLRSILC